MIKVQYLTNFVLHTVRAGAYKYQMHDICAWRFSFPFLIISTIVLLLFTTLL